MQNMCNMLCFVSHVSTSKTFAKNGVLYSV